MAQVALSQPAYTGSLRWEGSPSEMLKELCWLMLGSTMEILMHLKATMCMKQVEALHSV